VIRGEGRVNKFIDSLDKEILKKKRLQIGQ